MNRLIKNNYLLQLVLLGLLLLGMGTAQAAEHCEDEFYIDKTFASGARWDMCWAHAINHGIRYHHIYYTPKNGTRRMVLYDAAVAQIHVPYDDNGARFHDVSDYGLGGNNLSSISAEECPSGTLREYLSKNAVCTQEQKKGAAYRHGSNVAASDVLKVFSISQVGAYVYIPQWLFYDDGRIEPSMLATGTLQRFGINAAAAPQGWLVDETNSITGRPRIGLSHVHNYVWRLDFDLNGTGDRDTNDIVREINYSSSAGRRTRTMTTFSSEAARSVSPSRQRSWLISDGSLRNSKNHLMGYEIRLNEAGHREVGPSFEAFTHNDFYVTRANYSGTEPDCEQIASHNRAINGESCADSLDQFVNGQSLSGQDLVTWVGISFYHMPRSEDTPKMDSHSNKFEIIPRDWHAKNPLGTIATVTNPAPVGVTDTVEATAGVLETFDVLANDTGNGLVLIAAYPSTVGGATVSVVNNRLQYTASSSFTGEDRVWYFFRDVENRLVWGTEVRINVSGGTTSNPAPVGVNDTATTSAGSMITIDVLANDVGNQKAINYLWRSYSWNGGSVGAAANRIRYTPRSGFVGTDYLWYAFRETDGRTSQWTRVTITVQ